MDVLSTVKNALGSRYDSDKNGYGMWSIKGRAVAVCDLCVHLVVGSYDVGAAIIVPTARAVVSLTRIIFLSGAHAILHSKDPSLSPERGTLLDKILDTKTDKKAFKAACIEAFTAPLGHLALRVSMVVTNLVGLGFPDMARHARCVFAPAAPPAQKVSPTSSEGSEGFGVVKKEGNKEIAALLDAVNLTQEERNMFFSSTSNVEEIRALLNLYEKGKAEKLQGRNPVGIEAAVLQDLQAYINALLERIRSGKELTFA